jgi:hypothetical protein
MADGPVSEQARAAEETKAARAAELLGEARQLRDRLVWSGLGVWTLGLDDLIDELRRVARKEGL